MSDVDPEFEFDEELARLRESYARELPKKLDRLGALLQEARERGDAPSLDAAWRLAHSLKGSSGSYGFRPASRALQRIESSLGGLLEGEPPTLEECWPGIEGALAEARASLPGA